jgi:hypothetical protein
VAGEFGVALAVTLGSAAVEMRRAVVLDGEPRRWVCEVDAG